ncbi:MAG: hypothetical protein RJA49_2616 [Actinomycetota bacterium]
MTLQTIADEVGVSRMTVSNAFSRPDQLSADLRDRILDTATRLGYTGPDPAARALAKGSAGTIGLLFTDTLEAAFLDEISARLLSAVSTELSNSGRGMTLLDSKEHGALVPARDIPMDGALVYNCGATSSAVDWLRRRKVPLVFVDQEPVPGYPCLNVDDQGGARDAAQHIVDLGHRKVALVAPVPGDPTAPIDLDAVHHSSFTVQRRATGWLEPLGRVGVTPLLVNADASTEECGRTAARVLLGLPAEQRPTAVLAYSDRIALGVIRELQEAGFDVPGDVSVVGFDDANFAALARPALTTVRQDVERKGTEATALLEAAIESRAAQQRTDHRLLPTELVVRASTGPAISGTTVPS